MKKIAFILFSVFIYQSTSYAQIHTYGSVVNDSLLNIKTLPSYQNLAIDQPLSIYSLKQYCPTPGNQGEISSCTAWALGYSMLTIKHAVANNLIDKNDIDKLAFSSMFIYNSIRLKLQCQQYDACGSCGSIFTDGIKFLMNFGDVSHADINDLDCTSTFNSRIINEAKKYHILNASTLFYTNSREYYLESEKVTRVIGQIYNNNPVFISMSLPKKNSQYSFFDENAYFKNGLWQPPYYAVPERSLSHALTVIGYNTEEQYFEILNSWGTQWADHGFCKISFKDFIKYTTYAGVFFMPSTKLDQPINEKLLSLSLERYTRRAGLAQTENKNINVKWDGSKYIATTNAGQLYKINFNSLPEGYYAYIMSCDENRKSRIHFPINNENSYIFKSNLSYTLPQNSVLVFNQATDNLIIILSKYEINDFKQRFSQVISYSPNLRKGLENSFNASIKQYGVRFSSERLDAYLSPEATDPIILLIHMQTP